ncbi:HAD-IA family hydrolase [Halobaculum sp. WSA2]|uniref:HAD-IA family hydrolase n=1 Tax=Halobaculum saliterrae TaxID=2073113 RepID=A0A6B0SMP3_9EURY|nr:HAD family hydrolase [Halobaculum saliterrae]MXR40184.1 HAD-IA family hydrolase [Halobaculum saliterrae]
MTIAIWFDLDGTLVSFPDYGRVLATACEAVGIGDADAFAAAYNDAFFEYFGDLTPEPYRRAAADALATVDADAAPESFVTAVRDAEYDAVETPPAVRETLSTLAAADDVAVGVCTNGVPEWQRRKLRDSGLVTHVDATVVSYEAGAHKPAPEPFERAEALIEADRRVMIGDGEESDVAGARERGWEAVHVDGPADVPAAVDSVR